MNTFFTFLSKKITQLAGLFAGARLKVREILSLQMPKTKLKEGFLKNPSFYFGFSSFALLALLFLGSGALAKLQYSANSQSVFFNPFFKTAINSENNDLFLLKSKTLAIETPDLKIIEGNFVYGISTPRILTTQTLGTIFGESSYSDKKDVIEYAVQPGDTVTVLAEKFGISENTIAWANGISRSSALKVGQNLTMLPISGILHIVKSGDTIGEIARIYKANTDDIIAFNNLANEGDIFIGDILIIPGGVMPAKPSVVAVATLADNFFILPVEGKITQGLHYYNGVDVANKCGTPIYTAAAGTVQRAVANGKYNAGKGNHINILHSNGVVSYYGHLMTLFVKPGDIVNVGDRIALMGTTGASTGCHVHFQVMGAKNPLAKYLVGTNIKYK